MTVLGLPPCPPELKSISPYLQRADELTTNDPVIAYWCAYYAAQAGIALKPKDPASRALLMTLLNTLEKMKKDASPNDAIDDEAVSSAYIENFALRVFASADNEDRSGEATRGTAKKFLASANFLEILRTFGGDKPDLSSDNPNEEKIRYAKWKAADIAKAFREGRKPTPGPAGGAPALSVEGDFESAAPTTMSVPSPPSIARDTPPPPHLTNLPSPQEDFSRHTYPGGIPAPGSNLRPGANPHTPGAWSTIATPGTPTFGLGEDSPLTSYSAHSAAQQRTAFVSEELEGRDDGDEFVYTDGEPDSAKKNVHFTPSIYDSADAEYAPYPSAPDVVITDASSPQTRLPASPSAPPLSDIPAGSFVPASPPAPVLPSVLPPVPPSAPHAARPAPPPAPEPATVTPALDLTPVMISRVQKHCRFAISSLDYEDAEQARKELRAALQILGG